MHLKVFIFTLSFLTTSAYPLHRSIREANQVDLKMNYAHDKTDFSKDMDKIYKSKIDSDGLYTQDIDHKNPLAEELHRKFTMESERLRIRLRQELAELQKRLSSSATHPSSSLASMRERLTPLTQQLQSSVSSNTQDLCSQLSLYLQGLEVAEAHAEAGPTLYQEAFQWMGQTLEHSSSNLASIIGDFHDKANGVIEYVKQTGVSEEDSAMSTKVCEESSSRLGREVGLLKDEAQSRVGNLKAQLAALLESVQPPRAQLTSSVEQFCQNASLQSEVLQARMERLFMGLEEELEFHKSSNPSSSSSSSTQENGSLQEDFSVQLSALIQDILHSVQ